MGIVPTDNLMPGMCLAADVHDRNGRLLLGAGTELTDKHLHIFRTWGVIEVDVSGAEEVNDARLQAVPVDPEIWAAAEAEVMALFRHTDLSHPVMNQLLNLGIQWRISHGIR